MASGSAILSERLEISLAGCSGSENIRHVMQASSFAGRRGTTGLARQERIWSMLWLVLEALDTGHVHRPGQRRAAPALLCRTQLGAAVERAHPQAIGRRVGARGRRIERCAAFGAEPMRPLVPAFSGLDVDLWCSALQSKSAGQARHVRAKSGAGEGLTIGAMADPDLGWVDLGLEADLSAMAASGNFHRHFSLTTPARYRAR